MTGEILNYSEEGQGEPLLILHGLFGSSLNWKTLGRDLANRFRVLRIDLRNHGDSFHDEGMDYALMAEDVERLMAHLGIERARVLGHSMGGKVAMKLARVRPQLVERLVVADIAPVAYRHDHDDVLQPLLDMDLSAIGRRSDADRQLARAIQNRGLRLFLLQNLVVDADGARWKINLAALADNNDKITGFEDIADWRIDTRSLFIRGETSDYVSAENWRRIETHFSDVRLVTLENAGHWLHAERPREFLQVVQEFLT